MTDAAQSNALIKTVCRFARQYKYAVWWLLAVSLLTACAGQEARRETVVLLVRHAEKAQVEGDNPPLSEVGVQRAEALRRVVEDADVTTVICSPFDRTRLTAEPLVRAKGLAVKPVEVDLKQPERFVENVVREIKTKHQGETVLVVSHSNTVPRLAEALGARNVSVMSDDEYDRLVMIVLNADGTARAVKARY